VTLSRRTFLQGLGGGAGAAAARSAMARPSHEIWTFDSLRRVADLVPRVEGNPTIIHSPIGKAVLFDGVDDALFIDRHPLAGATRFTFEALFRPDGGAFEQRWFHLESDCGGSVKPGTGTTRMLFEIRVVDESWYLDAFVRGEGYSQVLMVPEKRFPLRRWYHVAQTYDGVSYRSYVNGQMQAEAPVSFKPQGPGRASVGIRLNHVNPFRGAVRRAAFMRDEGLRPESFLLPFPRS